MHGEATFLVKAMTGVNERFYIPVYQRNYNWKIANCKQLLDDLFKVILEDRQSHFFGSVVVAHGEGSHDRLIIDGQQRLTTVTLMLLALVHLLDEEAIAVQEDTLKKRIMEQYLVDPYNNLSAERIKLRPIEEDRKALERLFDEPYERIADSNISLNYEFLKRELVLSEYSADDIFQAICKLEVIWIQLGAEDNPQLIFESLNSTGLDLSEGDKIRNYVLMGLSMAQQNDFYYRYWKKIEENTDDQVDLFIRDYLTLVTKQIPNMKDIYFAFKEYLAKLESDNIEALLKELLYYAKLYRVLLHGTGAGDELDGMIYRLNRLETKVTRPFLLEVLALHKAGTLTSAELEDVFSTVENYIFRRTICDVATNALNKVFASLHQNIIALDQTTDNYVDKMCFLLLKGKESKRYPDNHEFKEALRTKNIYNMQAKNRQYYFERLENYGTMETKDVWTHLDKRTYSIEHIMPQSLSKQWAKELAKDGNPEDIHEKWLHKAANLTLTAYNTQYSNSPFAEKRDTEKGFKASGLRMNQWISQQEHWGVKQLEERMNLIVERSLMIWQYPTTQYQPLGTEEAFVTLADTDKMTGKKIKRVVFKGSEIPVTAWVDMFERILILLHGENKAILKKVAYSQEDGYLENSFATTADVFNNSRKIDEHIYVNTNTDTEMKLRILREAFDVFGEDKEQLRMYLRLEGEKMPANMQDQARFNFWQTLHDYMVMHESVMNARKPHTGRWTDFLIGVKHAHICVSLISSRNEMSVELYINEDKALFDQLRSHKDEIEAETGMEFVWSRMNSAKASRIRHYFTGFDTGDQSNYQELAEETLNKMLSVRSAVKKYL
ncbi:Uncharacterized conserved protein, contains ParB-like and HNH nuclease domains [Granulicatella balaenopterae]|uniref:Uncharacterized conserved protein, contains ParB-like and HNH nuclease domains n=1 Tax=Granulicatella balaenopterae TaxID=137733 RepID=A0A1H9NJV4_9LACT|nr:DUF4268 domain-containing protein [Granulicatella balaenopterae]SER35945.1 Uncharacterized conserved protein, contains ParB-like and HNH nuclease domains [Granulicatella balaenopterae]